VGARLRACAGDDAFVARFGGDEFVIVFATTAEPQEVVERAGRWCGVLGWAEVAGTRVQVRAHGSPSGGAGWTATS
jgi:GGDEF domain-containing protein